MYGNDVRFFKYLSPEAALASIDSGTMKWTSPRLFNDPFDFPVAMDFTFSGQELAEALTDELVRMAYGLDEPIDDPNNKFIQASLLTRRLRNRPSSEDFKAFMSEANAESAQRFEKDQIQRRRLLSEFRNQFAVFCVSAKRDDLLMWAHYSKDHTGCVFQFRCLSELDRPLCAAQKVNYVENYPLIGSLDEYVKHLTGQSKIDYDNLFEIFAFTKSLHWAYEDEWRCVLSLRDHRAGYDYKSFIPEELEAVYIGYRATQELRDSLCNLLRERYPSTNVFSSSVNIQDYSMVFNEIR